MLGLKSDDTRFSARRLVNHYQPIVNLRTGEVLSVEVLGRMAGSGGLVYPDAFLPTMSKADLELLFFASLASGLETLFACRKLKPNLSIGLNISPEIAARPSFAARLASVLPPSHAKLVTLELLESAEFGDPVGAPAAMQALRAIGVSLALDDVGSGFSSLGRLRQLPLAAIKLDQQFVRNLKHQPEALHFVSSMLTLARGLRTRLIIEGVETEEIRDALTVLGVEAAQGYAIARPMSGEALLKWLASHEEVPGPREPRNLLGAYAAHLGIVDACRAMLNQSLPLSWGPNVRDPHCCAIGRYFDRVGLHDSPAGAAHKRFHVVIDRYHEDADAWEAATLALWSAFQTQLEIECAQAASLPQAGHQNIGWGLAECVGMG